MNVRHAPTVQLRAARGDMKRIGLFYLISIALCGGGILWVLNAGRQFESNSAARSILSATPGARVAAEPAASNGGWEAGMAGPFRENLRSPLSVLLIQIVVIVLTARFFGELARRMGQPSVIGEMIAGIVLGPSVAGALFPEFSRFVFPALSMGNLKILSQIGVVLFMFVVGMEMDVRQLRNKPQTALVVSHAGIVLPFFLGVALSLALYREMASGQTRFLPFALFIGIAMSITAFPVLARIIEERRMTKTFLGVTALTCAAINDVTAWTILAFVVAVAQAGSLAAFGATVVLVMIFVLAMIFAVRPVLARFPARWTEPGDANGGVMAGALVLVFLCAVFTEVIGIHALFGAFLAGVVMPDQAAFRSHLRERLEGFSTIFLLPVFFAFTGLRTQIGLLDGWGAWGLSLMVIALATLGKLGGSMLAARWTGMNWGEAFSLGALMNTRGLVELIVLNVGYDMGILSPAIFAMMVLMALVTTCLTGPLLTWGQSHSSPAR